MTWMEKYEILLKEELLRKDINAVMDWTYATTKIWISIFLNNLEARGIKLARTNKIPTELFLEAIDKDLKYFERKMLLEHKVNKLKGELK